MNERYMRVVLMADHLNELLQAEHFEAAKLTSKRLLGEVTQFYEELKADIESRKPQPVVQVVLEVQPPVEPVNNPV